MAHYSQPQVAQAIAKAENAAQNALWSIRRAYISPQQGAPAAFILLSCFIDFLGTLYAGADSTPVTFQRFIAHFMATSDSGAAYHPKDLYEALRSKLVHNYSIWQGKYVLTHANPGLHLTLDSRSRTVLDQESFFQDVEKASQAYFGRVKADPSLQQLLTKRISKVGTIEDVIINRRP